MIRCAQHGQPSRPGQDWIYTCDRAIRDPAGEARADIKGGPGGPSVMISINLGDQTVQKEITTDMVVRDDQEIILGELSQLGETK